MIDRIDSGPSRAFLEGLTTASPLAAGIALGVNVVLFTTLLVVVTPQFISQHDETTLAERGTDYDAVVTARVLALQGEDAPAPSVVVFGGSTTRASLLEVDLLEQLRARGLSGYRVLKLCTSRQSLWETLALAENLPTGLEGPVIIGVGPSLFTMGDEVLEELAAHPRLGIRSIQLDEALQRRQLAVAPRTGVYVIDNAAFLLPRLDDMMAKLAGGPPTPYVDSRYVSGPRRMDRRAEALIEDRAERVQERFASYDRHHEGNFALLERVVRTVRRSPARPVILVETPMNPAFVQQHQLSRTVDQHANRMRAFARSHGLTYVELNAIADLQAEHFFDWAHLDDREAVRRSAAAVVEVLPSVIGRSDDEVP